MSIFSSNPLPPITLPDPEVLGKYGKLALSALHALRKKAKAKGKEHGEFMMFHRCGFSYQEWRKCRNWRQGKF